MSDPLSDAEIVTILDSAERYINLGDHQAAYGLLEPVHEGGAVSGENLGRTSLLLGEACLGLDALDAAMYYYEEAGQNGTAEVRERAQSRIAEIRRRGDAVEAVDEGVEGEDEAEAVIRAAEDALENRDFTTAWQYFRQAYDGIQMTNPQISRAAVGLAECHLQASETQEAEGYLQVAESADASALSERIVKLRELIAQIDAGTTASADGVERSELDELHAAGLAAWRSSDWESAFRSFEQIYESPDAPATLRGRAALNMGSCCLKTGDYDAAVQYLTEASNTAQPEAVALANDFLAQLEDIDRAEEIVDRLDPDRMVIDD